MSFQKATRSKARFATSRGPLSVEQLWDLPLSELDAFAVGLEEDYNRSKGKSFLEKRTVKDSSIKVQFDVVLEILQTKSAEAEAAKEARDRKQHNEKIIALIEEKKDGELKGKTVKQLEAMLK